MDQKFKIRESGNEKKKWARFTSARVSVTYDQKHKHSVLVLDLPSAFIHTNLSRVDTSAWILILSFSSTFISVKSNSISSPLK